MRLFRILCVFLALAPFADAYAQTVSPAALAALKKSAQTDGLALGVSSIGSGPLTPQALTATGTTPGVGNVWGSAYTGSADKTLTDQANSPSMIGVGNNARAKSITGFKQYDGAREDQANQATYFLAKQPVLKPTISSTDPWIASAHSGIGSPVFASSTEKVCTQQTVVTTYDNSMLYTCLETYSPYVVSCSTTGDVSFTSVPAPDVAATIASYSCPTGSVNTGSTCTSTVVTTNDATTNYTCPTGQTLSGTSCLLTTSQTSSGSVSYSCPAGQTLSGTTCSLTTSTSSGPVVTQSCPTGTTLSGSDCITSSTYAATPNYVCSVGVLNGANCATTQYIYTAATYICPTSYAAHYSGQNTYCVSSAFLAKSTDPNFYLANDQENNLIFNTGLPNEWVYIWSYPIPAFDKNVYYDTTVTENWGPYWGPGRVGTLASKSCPSGQTLSGSTCTATVTGTTAATISSYSCPSGGTVSGSSCVTTSSTPATLSYSCPSGSTLSGSSCITTTTSTTPATVSYSCPSGQVLSGSTCTLTTTATTIATVSYSCPADYVLSGTLCNKTTVTITAATPGYACPTGYTLSGTLCTGAKIDVMSDATSSGCGALEGLAQ